MSLRDGLLALAVILAVAFGAVAWRLGEIAASEREKRVAAEAQNKVDASTAKTADAVASDKVIIIRQTEERAHAVEAIPSDDLDPAVRSAWLRGLRVEPSTDDPGQLPRTLPATEPG